MKKEKKVEFHFPAEELQEEDYSPIEIMVIKDYYKNNFLQLIDSVRLFSFNIINIDGERYNKKNVYRSLLFRFITKFFNI